MTSYFRHPGYDPPDFAGHWQEHGQQVELTMEGDLITACSICDPLIEAQRYAHNEKVRRDEIEAPLLARIDAALALHKPSVVPGLGWACLDWGAADCDHDDECPEIDLTICVECDGIREQISDEWPVIVWPCPTALALGATP